MLALSVSLSFELLTEGISIGKIGGTLVIYASSHGVTIFLPLSLFLSLAVASRRWSFSVNSFACTHSLCQGKGVLPGLLTDSSSDDEDHNPDNEADPEKRAALIAALVRKSALKKRKVEFTVLFCLADFSCRLSSFTSACTARQ